MPNDLPHSRGSVHDDRLEGRYANYFAIGHNRCEFVLEFGQRYADDQEQVHSRIVTGPLYAKELLRLLAESVEKYEAECGEIDQKD